MFKSDLSVSLYMVSANPLEFLVSVYQYPVAVVVIVITVSEPAE
jgi:hypothetical protein